MGSTRLAVLGSPIAHSKSPALHAAAYRVLGLDWNYGADEVTRETLPAYLDSRDASWRGLSLTMPLKRDVLPLLDWHDEMALLAGGANTLLFDEASGKRFLRGFNTDVYGIRQALASGGVTAVERVHLLGGGATAASVLVAVRELGASSALLSVRDPDRAADLRDLGARIGIEVAVRPFGVHDRSLLVPDVVVSTLPGGVVVDQAFPEAVRQGALLFDVAYEPWPSALASEWLAVGGTVVPGIRMLLHQALAQVRIFVGGNPSRPVENEAGVFAAMSAAVGL